MKSVAKWVLVVAIPLVTFLSAKADIFDDLAQAIRGGNARELVKYFNSSVELSIQDSEGMYSKAQAEIILRDFFTQHPPRGFNVMHRGSSAGGSKFAIGNYTTSDGTYRTSIFVKEVGGQLLIHEIKFEKE